MESIWIAAIAVAALFVLALAWVGRRLWRLHRGEEELEAGGSLGRQLFGRNRRDA